MGADMSFIKLIRLRITDVLSTAKFLNPGTFHCQVNNSQDIWYLATPHRAYGLVFNIIM